VTSLGRRIPVLLLVGALAACSPEPDPEQAVGARATAALAPFKRQLMEALQAGLADSPTAAIEVCRVEAPAIARAAGTADVVVGRSSHRVRNPANAPEPWMQVILDDYLADPSAREPRVVKLDDNRYGYAEPILTQPMCTVCHGMELAPELARTLAELYPDDAATGFVAGDLRGLFWVKLAATPAVSDAGGS